MKLKRDIRLMLHAAIVGGILLPTQLVAQKSWAEYDFVVNSLPWLTSKNPTGILFLEHNKISEVEFKGKKSNGDLINYHESNDSYQFGGYARSLYRINEKVVLKGTIDYTNFKGQNMSGSVFIDPYSQVLNITEFSNEDKGDKKLERYDLVGAVAVEAYKNIRLAGEFSFSAANYAKMKDLRHINELTDIKTNIGMIYSFDKDINVGLSYLYHKNIEGISFNKYSPSAKIYEMLLSYGNFWGEKTTFDSSLGILSSAKKPIYSTTHSLSAQASMQATPQTLVYLEASYSKGTGKFGIDKASSPIYYQYQTTAMDAKLSMRLNQGDNVHQIALSYEQETSNNNMNIWKKIDSSTGGSTIVYLDPKQVSTRKERVLSLEIQSQQQIKDFLPKWDYTLNADLHKTTSRATLYPYYRINELSRYGIQVNARRNIVQQKGYYSFALNVGYTAALNGDPYTDGSSTPSPTQVKPKTADQMMYHEYEYLTTPSLSLSPKLQYTHKLSKYASTAYIALQYQHHQALKPLNYIPSKQHRVFLLSFGITLL